MAQNITIGRATDFDLPLTRFRVGGAALLLGLFVLLAVGSRFWELGARALHHDESLHAVYSYYLYDRGEYKHDPLMHGPVLFHLTALGYWLFGVSDFAARIVPAILGVLLVWMPWKFRGWLGTKGALVASALALISPTMLYYSRFIREDIFAITWTVITVYAMWKYLEGGEDFHLYLLAGSWALHLSQKETSFLLAAVFGGFLALTVGARWLALRREDSPAVRLRDTREWHLLILTGALLLPLTSAAVLHLLRMDPPGGYNGATYQNMAFLQSAGAVTLALFALGLGAAAWLWNWRKFLAAAAIFYTIFVVLHTTLLTWPWGIGSGLVGALGYWIEQHGVERGSQPWYYYSLLLPLYEFLPLGLGLGGAALILGRRRNGPVFPRDAEAAPHLDARALWPWFNGWWLAGSFFILSYAGEKMPWLLVHIAFPTILLAGWAMGRFLDGVDWTRARRPEGLAFGLLWTLLALAITTLAWLALGSQWPFRGTDQAALAVSARWLGAAALLALAGWGAVRARDRLGKEAARQVAVLSLSLLLALATVRFAVIAAYRNGDTPNEPLIYTQTAPDVPEVMREIEAISQRLTGGKDLKIAYDNSTLWPFEWYLRDYPNKFYYADNPSAWADPVRDASIVLVGLNNEELVKPLLPGYIRHHYRMRPNFPEDYKNLTRAATAQPDGATGATVTTYGEDAPTGPRSVANILRNVVRLAGEPQARADFLDFLWNRRMREPLGRFDFVVYVKPEVATEDWQYALTVATMDPALTRDPYADAYTQFPASVTLGQPGEFASPKNLALLPDGNLAVADSGNHRIRIVTPEGALVREFGTFGTAPGQFNEPWGIAAAPDGTLYVADTWNNRVQHLSAEGEVLHVWGSFSDQPDAAGGTFWGPRAVALDGQGNVYVTDTGNKQIEKFAPDGEFIAQFGGSGAAPGQFAEPVGIAVAPDGTIWVADTWNERVQSFTPDFAPLLQLPVRGWEGQSITNKPYLTVSDNRVWLSDPDTARIIELDLGGAAQRVWGQPGSDAVGLNLPLGLVYDGERLWVADSGNNRVMGYDVGP